MALGGVVAGCGFRPVHGRRGRGGAALTSVDVAPIADRSGQLLRNALLDRLRPVDDAPHELVVTLSLVDQDLGISEDDKPSLATLHGRAAWRLLTRMGDGRQRLDREGQSRAAVTYNILDNQYATERNRRAGQESIAEQIAADIEARLIAHFGSGGTGSGGPVAYPGF